jgi:hypothetical protein
MKRQCTRDKYAAIASYFNTLYETKRIRFDDAILQTAQHFFCSIATVMRAMRTQKAQII